MAQAFTVRLPDGREVRPEDWTAAPLYSTVEIATGNLTPLDAFSYGIGGPVPGSVGPRNANLADTNFQGQGNVLPENEELLLYSLCISLFQVVSSTGNFINTNEVWTPDPPHVTLTNVLRVQRDTLVALYIANTKQYCSMPLSFFAASCGVEPYFGSARSVASGNTQTELVGSNGGVSENMHRLFATPHQIAPGEAFNIQFTFPAGAIAGLNFGVDANARIQARTYTRGVRRRPVA